MESLGTVIAGSSIGIIISLYGATFIIRNILIEIADQLGRINDATERSWNIEQYDENHWSINKN